MRCIWGGGDQLRKWDAKRNDNQLCYNAARRIEEENWRLLIAPEDPGSETIRVPVLKVFDGDGFLTRIDNPRRGSSLEVTIRLGFIDAPEMEQPGGIEARDFLQSLIGAKHVDLAILMKMDTGGIVDRHKRIVAVPYLQMDQINKANDPASRLGQFFRGLTAPSHRNIELEMILNGWAWVLDRYGPMRATSRRLTMLSEIDAASGQMTTTFIRGNSKSSATGLVGRNRILLPKRLSSTPLRQQSRVRWKVAMASWSRRAGVSGVSLDARIFRGAVTRAI